MTNDTALEINDCAHIYYYILILQNMISIRACSIHIVALETTFYYNIYILRYIDTYVLIYIYIYETEYLPNVCHT